MGLLKAEISGTSSSLRSGCLRRKLRFLGRFAPVGTLSTAEPVRCQPCRLARNSTSGC
nr:MAG TPA: hypothetical protein [Microviridae sp.]